MKKLLVFGLLLSSIGFNLEAGTGCCSKKKKGPDRIMQVDGSHTKRNKGIVRSTGCFAKRIVQDTGQFLGDIGSAVKGWFTKKNN